MRYKVLITTSGTGSRLKELTSFTNKSLVRIGGKPAISHIVEGYPVETQFVVTLGHFGNQVKDFLSLAYPERHFEYVEVKNFEGPGSSLGRSMLDAQHLLQCPFIFHACDTIVSQPVPHPDKNWIGGFKGNDTSQYASWMVREGRLSLNEKGSDNADYLHIGLVGIYDFKIFWESLADLFVKNPANHTLNDCQALSKMIEKGSAVDMVEFLSWYDIGNVEALGNARLATSGSPEDLYKVGESIFVFDGFVIKFFADEKIAQNRAERGRLLEGFVPKIEGSRGNFYRYKFVEGDLYANVAQQKDFKEFLEWTQNNFWRDEFKLESSKFKEICHSFYFSKTHKRINQFLQDNNLVDTEHIINGEKIPSIGDIFNKIDFDRLTNGLQSRFHGDFILDNILKTKQGFTFIDWRQDFGGDIEVGDRYYDFAKLNHNLTVNHSVINHNLYKVESDGKNVLVEIMRPSNLVDCHVVLFEFFRKYKYDNRKVRFLTSIVWLNMAPLHHYPFNLFLYYYGKLTLWRSVKENEVVRKA